MAYLFNHNSITELPRVGTLYYEDEDGNECDTAVELRLDANTVRVKNQFGEGGGQVEDGRVYFENENYEEWELDVSDGEITTEHTILWSLREARNELKRQEEVDRKSYLDNVLQ